MTEKQKLYFRIKEKYPSVLSALESMGEAVRSQGPVDAKTSQLIQLAGAAASQSEGSVHSHVRRALAEGATKEEIEHTVLLLISVIGFPKTAAALSWVFDELDG